MEYIANDNPAAATRVAERIAESVYRLPEHPGLGRPGRIGPTRELVITGTSYLAIYRIADDQIQILRILHGAQRWPEG